MPIITQLKESLGKVSDSDKGINILGRVKFEIHLLLRCQEFETRYDGEFGEADWRFRDEGAVCFVLCPGPTVGYCPCIKLI